MEFAKNGIISMGKNCKTALWFYLIASLSTMSVIQEKNVPIHSNYPFPIFRGESGKMAVCDLSTWKCEAGIINRRTREREREMLPTKTAHNTSFTAMIKNAQLKYCGIKKAVRGSNN